MFVFFFLHDFEIHLHLPVNYKLVLAIGTCHLPLQGLNHGLLQLLIFKTSERSLESRAEMRHSMLGV